MNNRSGRESAMGGTIMGIKEKTAIATNIGTGLVMGLSVALLSSYLMAGFYAITDPSMFAK